MSVVGIGVWSTWGIASLVQRWVNGSAVNQGVLLKETDESIQNIYTFDGVGSSNPPSLTVTWQPWLGEQPFWTYSFRPLTDRSHLHVNVANGNLVVHARDLTIAGTGLPLDLERYYNSLAPAGARWGRVGR